MTRVLTLALLLGACGTQQSSGDGGMNGTSGFTATLAGGGPTTNTVTTGLRTSLFLLVCASNSPNVCQYTAGDIMANGCPRFELYANGVPTTGTTYNLVNRTSISKDVELSQDTFPLDGNLIYTEIHGGSCTGNDPSTAYEWVSSGGTVHVDSVSGVNVTISFEDVPMVPDDEASTSKMAMGNFEISGSGTTTSASGLSP